MHYPCATENFRPTYAEISLAALQHNIRVFSSKLKKETLIMAVVKADGYGHGAVQAANAALDAGATHLAVACLDEAVELRKSGIQAPVLVLGYTPAAAIETAASLNISITVFSWSQMNEIALLPLRSCLGIHLKVDTGMSRLGVTSLEEAIAIAGLANRCEFVQWEGIFTHFADADGSDTLFTEWQFARFMNVLRALREKGINYQMAHCCNSTAIWRFPQFQLDMVRLGIGMYGYSPLLIDGKPVPELKKAMKIVTEISSVKQYAANVSIGYNRTYFTRSNEKIAVLPIGYADGLNRRLSNLGYVTIRGEIAPIVGKICMDQTMIDVSHFAELQIGEKVTVLGRDEDGVTAENWAEWLHTIHYEVICGISKRVPRVYV